MAIDDDVKGLLFRQVVPAPIKSMEPISFRPSQIAGDGGSQRNVSGAFTNVAHISSHALRLGVGSAATRLRL